jgi:hypothetical protein
MNKTEVYSWRLNAELKDALEEAARLKETSMAHLLDQIVSEWLGNSLYHGEEEEQRQLHQSAAQALGRIRGGDPTRSAQVKQQVRARLKKRRAS